MEKLADVIARLGLTVTSTFVPLSQSRHKDGKWRCLNWRVSVRKGEREIVAGDYSAGEAHAPAYRTTAKVTPWEKGQMIARELETGRVARWNGYAVFNGGPILPDSLGVIASFALDARAIDSANFEDWASEYGYDTDSREAEANYRQCLAHGLALRAALGDADFRALCDAACDY